MFNLQSSYLLFAAMLPYSILGFASTNDIGSALRASVQSLDDMDNLISIYKRSPLLDTDGMPMIVERSSEDSFSSVLRRNVDQMMGTVVEEDNQAVTLAKRQSPTSMPDPIQWNINVLKRCNQTLQGITAPGDPAGVVVCYNLPYFDPSSGIFQSDLRLYKVTPAEAPWEALGRNVSISLQYQGAMVQVAPSIPTSAKRDLEERQTMTTPNTVMPQLLRTFSFVGQINSDMLSKANNLTGSKATDMFKQLLTPNIALVGKAPATGAIMNTTLPYRQAYFLTGVFALNDNSTNAEPAPAQSGIAKPAKFKLPGTVISITPVGLYLYTIYLGLFVLIVGYGTFERYKFRMIYRRRIGYKGGDI